MGTLLDEIKKRFKQKDLLIQLIIINVAVFALLLILKVFTTLFQLEGIDVIEYIAVSSNFTDWIRFWTPFTYMFVHEGFLHIFFNMLLLYWFGQMFLSYFNPRVLGSLYILGGLAGALLYLIAFNTIPYYLTMGHSLMIGASASVMAIIFGVAFYRPDASMRLLLLGEVKIVYIAIFFFIMDFFALDSTTNPGGHVAHIGGAILGYIFALQYRKGKDITRWMTKILDSFANFSFKRKTPKMKVRYKKREAEYEFNGKKNNEQEAIDKILDKIKASGYSSLTKEEKQRLFNASKK